MCRLKPPVTALVFVLLSNHALAQSAMPMEDSWGRTLGFILYVDARATQSDIYDNSPHYSFVWDGVAHQDDFRTTNPRSSLGTYVISLLDDHDGRPDRLEPGGDSPESRLRTLHWWIYEADGVGHPDWILYRCDGVTPAYLLDSAPSTLSNMPLDFTNPAVIDWKLQNVELAPSSVTALSADYFTIGNWSRACGAYRDGEWIQLFTGDDQNDPAYEAAAINYAREIRSRLAAQRYPKGLVVNCPTVVIYEPEQLGALLANIDGVLDEYGFTEFDSRNGWWPLKIQRIIDVQNRGVAYYSVNYVSNFPPTQEQLNWILGSFLMARQHSAYLTITEPISDIYPHPSWPHLPQYDVDVGHPCGEMTTSQGVYVRDFSNGMSVVNPSDSDWYTFVRPAGNFTDLYGTPVDNEILLGPLSGKVLVSAEPRCL